MTECVKSAQVGAAIPHAIDAAHEGALYADAYLDRLRAGTAQPEELAVLCEFLRGEMLHAFCAAVHRVLLALRCGGARNG